MRFSLPLMVVLAVAACATPQERCIRAATSEIRTLDGLIAEAEANIARGYGYETRQVVRHVWTRCEDYYGPPPYHRRMCFEPVEHTVRHPVAIDPEAETRKIRALKERRAALVERAQSEVAACRARYPEA